MYVCVYVCDVCVYIHYKVHMEFYIMNRIAVRLPVPSLRALLSLAADGVDLVHEDDRRGGLAGHHEQLSHHAGPFTKKGVKQIQYVCVYVCMYGSTFSDVLLDQLRSGHSNEGAVRVMSHYVVAHTVRTCACMYVCMYV